MNALIFKSLRTKQIETAHAAIDEYNACRGQLTPERALAVSQALTWAVLVHDAKTNHFVILLNWQPTMRLQ